MIIIPIHLDYGAEGAIWYSPFESHTEIINFWGKVEHVEYRYPIDLTPIFPFGKLQYFQSINIEFLDNLYFSSPIKIMIDNNYASYLKIKNKYYYHQGFIGEPVSALPKCSKLQKKLNAIYLKNINLP